MLYIVLREFHYKNYHITLDTSLINLSFELILQTQERELNFQREYNRLY